MSMFAVFNSPAALVRSAAHGRFERLGAWLTAVSALLAAMISSLCLASAVHAQQGGQSYLPSAERNKRAVEQGAQAREIMPDARNKERIAASREGGKAERGGKAQPDSFDVAVIIGNQFYLHDGVEKTAHAHADADAMRALLIETYGFNPEKIIWLKDTGQAEMRAIFGTETTIQGRIWRTIDPEGRSRVFVYYSGHGTHDTLLRKPHILPADTEPADVAITGYPLEQLYVNLSKLNVKAAFVMLEAGFSGRGQTGMLIERAQPAEVSAAIPKSRKLRNVTVLSAASGKQFTSQDNTRGHGLFTSYLLSGLKGAADANADGAITASELHGYVQTNVSEEANRLLGREQTPELFGNADFVIGRYRVSGLAVPPVGWARLMA